MNERGPGLAGVLRVIYFLGLGSLLIIFVMTAVTNIYEGPSGQQVTSAIRDVFIDQEEDDYNRNLGIIFSLIGSGLMVAGLAMLRPDMNGVRTGLLFGGLLVLFTGIGYASSGSSDWLVVVWSLVGVVTLAAAAPYIEIGGGLASRLRPPPPPPPTPPTA